MIKGFVIWNLFNTREKHIVVPIPAEEKMLPKELEDIFSNLYNKGRNMALGQSIAIELNGKIFYGIVCYQKKENGKDGWEEASQVILDFLDSSLETPEKEPIAILFPVDLILAETPVHRISEIEQVAEQSRRQVTIYTK